MKEVCVNNGHVPESGEEEEDRVLPATVSWHDIARSVRSRTAMQCRQKWVMSLSWKSKDSSQMWSVDDTIQLLEALGSMADVVSEDEVDWTGLSQKWSVHWTHYYLRERWGRLRRDVPNYRVKSFQGNGCPVLQLCGSHTHYLLSFVSQMPWIISSHTSSLPSKSKGIRLPCRPVEAF